MTTKFCRMVNYREGFPPVKPHDLLITWSHKITWQTKIIISPRPQCLWPPNLTGWWAEWLIWGAPSHKVTFLLKVIYATKWQLLKICYLRQRLRIFLFRRKVMFRSQDIQVFVFLTIPWSAKSVTSRWVLVHETRYIFIHIFWTTTH